MPGERDQLKMFRSYIWIIYDEMPIAFSTFPNMIRFDGDALFCQSLEQYTI